MDKKRKYIAIMLICVFITGASAGGVCTVAFMQHFGKTALVDRDYLDRVSGIAEKYAKLEAIYNIIETDYYGDYTDEGLMNGIYAGLFSSLDKYSCYMTEEEYKKNTETTLRVFYGVGVVMSISDDNKIVILSVYRDSPAEKAGLKEGDIILEVDGEAYDGSRLESASNALRGEKGTKVKIKYSRNGKEGNAIMERDTINNETIYTGSILESVANGHKISYIGIESFGNGTAEDFEYIMRDLELDGTEGFILDLRNNPGGVVETACKVADMILKEGVIMTTKNRQGEGNSFVSEASSTTLPYVVLINENTASAAEIVAAAVKGNNAAKLVGTKTFGKGVVQYVRTISGEDASAIKLTFEEYFGPDDLKINEVGVSPDIMVEFNADGDTDNQLEAAIKELLKSM